MQQYVIGLDYGSLSARGILIDVHTGEVQAEAAFPYPHGILEQALPNGRRLQAGFALQHPQDYLDALYSLVPALMAQSGAAPSQVIGLGLDMTASTVLPVDEAGQPLCFHPAWRDEPHAYAQMWKHQAAQPEADRLNALAERRGEPWLKRYGGLVSSTWLFPKLLAIHEQCPALLKQTAHYLEGADWLVMQLTGSLSRNACAAGYKALYDPQQGYPSADYFEALSPGFGQTAGRLTSGPVIPPGQDAGGLLPAMAAKLGLEPRTTVAAGMVDAHAGALAAGLFEPGEMHSILGTSGCHLLLSREQRFVPGICGAVQDGILPGFIAYEAGQLSFGDHLNWLTSRLLKDGSPEAHQRLSEAAGRMLPGQTGLMALDWWDGNRSVLVDSALRGLLIGLSLQTTEADIYRALMEALALSTRLIADNFREHGLPVTCLSASGGISQKNPVLMQILSDALGLSIRVPLFSQGAALGSAMLAAAAAQPDAPDAVSQAVRRMMPRETAHYQPNPRHQAAYDSLYAHYRRLHDHYGRGENDIMKNLLRLKAQQDENARP